MKTNELMIGDCLELLTHVHDNSIDMVLADLPYGTTRCAWDEVIPFDAMWAQIERVIKPRTAVLLFAQAPFDKKLACSNLDMFRHEWIWEKSHATGFFNAKKMPLKAHENILVFYKKLPTYNPQKTSGHERKTATKKMIESECYGKEISVQEYDSTERYPRSVLKFSSDKQKSNLHPTQKPIALLEYFLKTYSNEGDTVLDFCMGSGSTGVACKRQNRKFIGIEKNKQYFDIARERINQTAHQLQLAV